MKNNERSLNVYQIIITMITLKYRYETIERTPQQQQHHHQQQQHQQQQQNSYSQNSSYADNYSSLISPEKVNTLERNKKDNKNALLSEINALDSAVYGGTNSYNQNSSYMNNNNGTYDHLHSSHFDSTYNNQTSSFSEVAPKFAQPYKPLGSGIIMPTAKNEVKSESKSYMSPDGYKTDSYKYESYQTSSSKPMSAFTSSSDKYFTSTPTQSKMYSGPVETDLKSTTFDGAYKNGSDHHQLMSFSNVEFINEPPLLMDNDSLEQRMCKQSLTQKIIEKKTVQMTSSSKQETSTKSFRFE